MVTPHQSHTTHIQKGTAIVSDVPSEAQLTPALWGRWELIAK